MYKTLSRRKVVLSFLISAIFGIILVVQGLFVQEPISTFSSQSQSTLKPQMDQGVGSSMWHPGWFRARYFYVDEDMNISDSVESLLHKQWFFCPSLTFTNESVEVLRDTNRPDKSLLIEFSENYFVEEVTTVQFDIHSPLSYKMFVNDVPLPTKQPLTLSKGSHRLTIRVLVPPEKKLDIRVQNSENGSSWQPWSVGEHHGYTQRHGLNRTGFRIPVQDIFEEGSDVLNKGATSRLEDLWFGINEGRFLGRIVIEVHNQDGSMSLSQRRALVLAKWLVEKGSPSKLITVQGYGDHWLKKEDSGRIDILLLH